MFAERDGYRWMWKNEGTGGEIGARGGFGWCVGGARYQTDREGQGPSFRWAVFQSMTASKGKPTNSVRIRYNDKMAVTHGGAKTLEVLGLGGVVAGGPDVRGEPGLSEPRDHLLSDTAGPAGD